MQGAELSIGVVSSPVSMPWKSMKDPILIRLDHYIPHLLQPYIAVLHRVLYPEVDVNGKKKKNLIAGNVTVT